MDCIVHGVAKSWIQLSNFHFTFTFSHLWLCLSTLPVSKGENVVSHWYFNFHFLDPYCAWFSHVSSDYLDFASFSECLYFFLPLCKSPLCVNAFIHVCKYVAIMCPVLLFAFNCASLFMQHSDFWVVGLVIPVGILWTCTLGMGHGLSGSKQTLVPYFLASIVKFFSPKDFIGSVHQHRAQKEEFKGATS